ncbi:hypothetical protein B9T62_06545 [Paenibacillus donghaensis]|uniref:Uncharacterized protein n=1 Tax=Paenibacillus donghaensis TaxID=414771 RepID=A0A2Z2KKR5_9BACL|nr:hypothetical protein [Paenibacillus donghaensis]ASA20491.1 hypothetical protein B9T62_06545 [Paenibacillus donghaensis]
MLQLKGYGVQVTLPDGKPSSWLPLLVRMDAGNDALEISNVCLNEHVDFIVKRNLRRESLEEWLIIARQGFSTLNTPTYREKAGGLGSNLRIK